MKQSKKIISLTLALVMVFAVMSIGTASAAKGPGKNPIGPEPDPDISIDLGELEVEDIIIVLDPGHGGEDTGAVADVDDDGVVEYERDLDLKIANYLKSELETYYNIVVVMTREDNDSNPSHEDRGAVAGLIHEDYPENPVYLISIHNNAGGSNGAEAYISVHDGEFDWGAGDLAAGMLYEICEKFALYNRGVKDRTDAPWKDWYGINEECAEYGVASIILEHCFMDNDYDAGQCLSTETKLEALAKGDADAIAGCFGLVKLDN